MAIIAAKADLVLVCGGLCPLHLSYLKNHLPGMTSRLNAYPNSVGNCRYFLVGQAVSPVTARCSRRLVAAMLLCGAGWNPARRLATGAHGGFLNSEERVSNPPQVNNLPHDVQSV